MSFSATFPPKTGIPAKTPEPEVGTRIRSDNLKVLLHSLQISSIAENSPITPSTTFRRHILWKIRIDPSTSHFGNPGKSTLDAISQK